MSPLTPTGWNQARFAVPALARFDPEIVVTSDLRRATDTATVFTEASGVPLRIDKRLRETNLGQWQSLTGEQVEEGWPGAMATWQGDATWAPPDGESRVDVANRTIEVVAELDDEFERTVAAVRARRRDHRAHRAAARPAGRCGRSWRASPTATGRCWPGAPAATASGAWPPTTPASPGDHARRPDRAGLRRLAGVPRSRPTRCRPTTPGCGPTSSPPGSAAVRCCSRGAGWTARDAWWALAGDPNVWASLPKIDALVLAVGSMDTLPSPLPTYLRTGLRYLRPDRSAPAGPGTATRRPSRRWPRLLGGHPVALPPALTVRYLDDTPERDPRAAPRPARRRHPAGHPPRRRPTATCTPASRPPRPRSGRGALRRDVPLLDLAALTRDHVFARRRQSRRHALGLGRPRRPSARRWPTMASNDCRPGLTGAGLGHLRAAGNVGSCRARVRRRRHRLDRLPARGLRRTPGGVGRPAARPGRPDGGLDGVDFGPAELAKALDERQTVRTSRPDPGRTDRGLPRGPGRRRDRRGVRAPVA